MPDTKISDLTAASALGGTEPIPLVQSGTTRRATPAQIATYVQSTLTKSNLTATTNPGPTADSAAGYSAGSVWLNVNTGVTWRCRSASAGAAVWATVGVMEHPGYVTGRWYRGHMSSVGTVTVAADTLYAHLFVAQERLTVDMLGLRVLTGVGSTNARIGIYAHDAATHLPAGLVGEGSAAVATTTTNSNATIAPSGGTIALEPGIYWVASLFSGAPGIQGIANSDTIMPAMIGVSSSNLGAISAGYGVAQSYASGLPATFPTPGTASAIPGVSLRVA